MFYKASHSGPNLCEGNGLICYIQLERRKNLAAAAFTSHPRAVVVRIPQSGIEVFCFFVGFLFVCLVGVFFKLILTDMRENHVVDAVHAAELYSTQSGKKQILKP